MSRLEEEQHVKNECRHRPCRCPNDACALTFKASELDAHIGVCVHGSLPCTVEGCEESWPKWMLSDHIADCPHRLNDCPFHDCGKRVKSMNMDKHLEKCAHRPVQCSYHKRGCNEETPSHVGSAHERQCPYRPWECPNDGCWVSINAIDSSVHASKCPYRLVDCPTGFCTTRVVAKEAKAHAKECVRRGDKRRREKRGERNRALCVLSVGVCGVRCAVLHTNTGVALSSSPSSSDSEVYVGGS